MLLQEDAFPSDTHSSVVTLLPGLDRNSKELFYISLKPVLSSVLHHLYNMLAHLSSSRIHVYKLNLANYVGLKNGLQEEH